MGEPVYPFDNRASEALDFQPPSGRTDFHHQLPEHSQVQDTAEKIGTAVGTAVSVVRGLPDRLQEMKRRFTVIRGRAQGGALDKATDLKDKAGETFNDLKDKAGERLIDARLRARRVAREYPLAVIAGAAGVGVIVGVLLRIWRDHD